MSDKNLLSLASDLTFVCAEQVANYCAINIPFDLMAEIVGGSKHLEEDLLKHYEEGESGLDTFTRDDLLDAVAKKFTTLGRWPLNMDTDKTSEQFFTELVANAAQAGCESTEKTGHLKVFGGKRL